MELEKKTIETADGEKVEVYDAVKVEEAIKANEDGLKTAGEEKTQLETDLKEATDKLEKADEKSGEFKELREHKEKLEGKVKENAEALETSKKTNEELTEKLGQTEQKYRKDTFLKSIAGDDEELLKKIEFHLEKTVSGMPDGTAEELESKLKAAYTQATGVVDADKLNSIISSAGGGKPGASEGKVSDELVEFGKNFGLEAKDFDNAADKKLI